MQWSTRPFLRIVIFYALGIIPGYEMKNMEIDYVSATVVFVLLTTIAFLAVKFLNKHKYDSLKAILLFSCIFLFGFLNTNFRCKNNQQDKTIVYSGSIIAEVVSDVSQTNNVFKAELYLNGSDSSKNNISSKALAYFAKSPQAESLKYGDIIVLNSTIQLIKNKGNPGEFDYAGFLFRKSISHRIYLKENNWTYIEYKPSNKIIAKARALRHYVLKKLEKDLYFTDSYPIAAALLTGYDDLMDDDTENDFMRAGAMHILCVSGLHVGIIFMLLSNILKLFFKSRSNNIFKIIILLAGIWAYALFTGFSASVERSAMMFSFFAIGQGLSRHRDPINTLAASGFIMLLINPLLIYSAGFQLSFAAVAGIIILFKPIHNLLFFKNIIAKYLWSILSVSIAAQIATFPIAAHYFHYFPNYFWLTNLIVIPASFIAVSSGFVYAITLFIPYIHQILAFICSASVMLIKIGVEIIGYLPAYGFDNIYMPLWKIISLFGLIYFTYMLLVNKNIKHLKYVSLIIFFIAASGFKYNLKKQKEEKLIIYNFKNAVIQFNHNGQSEIIATDEFYENETSVSFLLKNSLINDRIKSVNYLGFSENITRQNFYQHKNFFSFGNKNAVLIADLSIPDKILHSKIKSDYLIISGRKSIKPELLFDSFKPDKIIICADVPYWKRNKIIEYCKSKDLEYFDVKNEGAFVEMF